MKTENYSLRSRKSLSQTRQWPMVREKKFQNCEINLILLASRPLKEIYYLSRASGSGIQRLEGIWKEEKVNPLLSNAFASCVLVLRSKHWVSRHSVQPDRSRTVHLYIARIVLARVAQLSGRCEVRRYGMVCWTTCMLVEFATSVHARFNVNASHSVKHIWK